MLKKIILACTVLLLGSSVQAFAKETEPHVLSGEIAAKAFLFDHTGGVDNDRAHFLERYDYQKGWGGSNEYGFYMDGDLGLSYSDGSRENFGLERRGEGLYNHSGDARFNTDKVRLRGYYSDNRFATNGIEYLFSPDQVPGGVDPDYMVPATNTNSGYVAQFNNDSSGQSRYEIDRLTYGAGVDLKEALLGDGSSAAVEYDGYTRDGNRFFTYALGGSDVNTGSPTRALFRWRGFDKPVDENMDRGSVNLTASPGGLFQVSYDGALEKFDNQAQNFKHSDIPFPAGQTYNPASDATRPLGFVPDTTLVTNEIRLSKNFTNTSWGAGYGHSMLEQDSFTDPQILRNYETGKISHNSAYVTVDHQFVPELGVEGHLKYQRRDNNSSYPVIGLISGASSTETLAVWINKIETWVYGVAAIVRPTGMKTTMTPGWKHENSGRDLEFNNTGIIDAVSLYNEDSESDEIYLNVVSRPIQGLTARLTPSYTWANRTGLITEPEKSLRIKTQASYAAANGMILSGYYNHENRENSNNAFTDKAAPLATQDQDIKNIIQSAGLSVNAAVSKRLSAFAGFDWTNNNLDLDYFSTNSRRYETTPFFRLRDRSEYDVDTFHFSVGGDWQASDLLNVSGAYTYTLSNGHVASGELGTELSTTVDGTIDNTLHSLSLDAGYTLRPGMELKTGYIFDYYDDNEYRNLDGSALSGGVHTIIVGLNYKF